jgi:hypothetical protein
LDDFEIPKMSEVRVRAALYRKHHHGQLPNITGSAVQ